MLNEHLCQLDDVGGGPSRYAPQLCQPVEVQIASNESDEIIANDVKKSQTLDQSTQSNDFDPDEEISEDFPVPIPYDI